MKRSRNEKPHSKPISVEKERRCRYCAERLSAGTVVCPSCHTPYVPLEPEHMITVLVGFGEPGGAYASPRPCPELHPVSISNRARTEDLLNRMVQLNIISGGHYTEVGIIRRLEDVPVLNLEGCKKYRDYRHGDIVLFKQHSLSTEEYDWVMEGDTGPFDDWDEE